MLKNASIHRVVSLLLFIALTGSGLGLCRAQNTANAKEPAQNEIGLDVQAYLLVASSDPVAKKVPTLLENVTKQLGAALGPNNYGLVATYIYRVKDGGNIDVTGIGNWSTISPAFAVRPVFYNFYIEDVSLGVNKGQPIIQIKRIKFGMSIPIVYQAQNVGTKEAVENIQYKDTGIVTQLNLPEGIPTVVGTMSTSQPDKMLILVLMVKRSQDK